MATAVAFVILNLGDYQRDDRGGGGDGDADDDDQHEDQHQFQYDGNHNNVAVSNANGIKVKNTCTTKPEPEPPHAAVVQPAQLLQPPHPLPEFLAPDYIERGLLPFDREGRRDMMRGEWHQQGRRRRGQAPRWMEAEGVEGVVLRVGMSL